MKGFDEKLTKNRQAKLSDLAKTDKPNKCQLIQNITRISFCLMPFVLLILAG